MTAVRGVGSAAVSPLLIPRPYRVVDRVDEADDIVTLHVVPIDGDLPHFEPAQVGMLGAFGVGEAAISISSAVDNVDHHAYTIRRAGPISNALVDTPIGGTITVRSPFGTPWPLPEVTTGNLLIVGGGLGIAPLRAVIEQAMTSIDRFDSVSLVYGARRPDQLLYGPDRARWQAEGLSISTIVDEGDDGWRGPVGLVTDLLGGASGPGIDGPTTTAFICGPDAMMAAAATALIDAGLARDRIWLTLERNMQCGNALCGHCQLGPFIVCRDGPVANYAAIERFHSVEALWTAADRPKLAVWKFASCDGCQLSLLDAEADLLTLADRVDIAYFAEASSRMVDGPYDVSLVEGSISTPEDAARIAEIRRSSRTLITIGACATAGGIQALRNGADIDEYLGVVYADPSFISTLDTSTPIADHVEVDFELRGCPIDRDQLVETIAAHLAGRPARIPTTSVCTECKARGTACVMVRSGTPCLGPVTMAGCKAICPAYDRGCYGCFGPMESPNTEALVERFVELGMGDRAIARLFRSYSGWSEPFRSTADDHDGLAR